jgi:hypothetical protein
VSVLVLATKNFSLVPRTKTTEEIMLKIDTAELIEGITVYADDKNPKMFYLIPNVPRFRINDNGLPSFAFYKYRNPIDRVDGRKGGGLLVCDTELSLPEAKRLAVTHALQARINARFQNSGNPPPQVEVGVLPFSKGVTKINVENMSNNFVEKVFNPGKPSLFGKCIAPFTVEFTETGVTFFEQARQNKGGLVQVVYDMTVGPGSTQASSIRSLRISKRSATLKASSVTSAIGSLVVTMRTRSPSPTTSVRRCPSTSSWAWISTFRA